MPGWEARVFLGSLLGATSPVVTHTPLLGAEVMLATGKSLEIEVDESFEHGVLLDVGAIDVDGEELKPGDLGLRRGRAHDAHRHRPRRGARCSSSAGRPSARPS